MKSRDNTLRVSIFVWLYAIASIWHHTGYSNEVFWYWQHFDPVPTPLVIIAIITGLFAALFPDSPSAFLTMVATHTLIAFIRLPFIPIHVVMEFFLGVSVLTAWLLHAWRTRRFEIDIGTLFDSFSPAGRCLLLVMHFFGTFHKLNPGFLSLHSSCAVDYLEGPPVPPILMDNGAFLYAAIYGVLVLEFVAMLLLLPARKK